MIYFLLIQQQILNAEFNAPFLHILINDVIVFFTSFGMTTANPYNAKLSFFLAETKVNFSFRN